MRDKKPLFLFSMPRIVQTIALVLGMLGSVQASAADLPLAAGSPLAGISFDDRPLMLSVQRNFQMAMLTASSELGRSCGKMEAYGWRMNQSEQQRVNQIFSNTVDRMRALGFIVESQSPPSVSRDITMFTADRPDKHFLFMWSAGEIGLVMVLCEASMPISPTRGIPSAQQAMTPAMPPQDVLQSKLEAPIEKPRRRMDSFSPVGSWVGNYTCSQGYTGATLQITHLRDENFDGVVRFYPTPKNSLIPKGSYMVYGQYDRESHRILINPGKWLEQPKGYYSTIIIGSFNPVDRTFSGYFQGVMGCTSFEATQSSARDEAAVKSTSKPAKAKKKPKKKAAPKKKEVKQEEAPIATAPVTAPAVPVQETPTPTTTPTTSETTAPAPAITTQPSAPAPAPAAAAPTPAPAAPAIDILPVSPPPPASAPAPQAVPPKPTSLLEMDKKILVAASGTWFTPRAPTAPGPRYITPRAPAAPTARYFTPSVPQWPQAPRAPQARYITPRAPEAPKARYFTPTVREWPQAPQAPRATYTNPIPPRAPEARRFTPLPRYVPNFGYYG